MTGPSYTIFTRGVGTCGHVHRTLTGAMDCLRRTGRHARGERRAPQIRVLTGRSDLLEFDINKGPGEPIREAPEPAPPDPAP